MSVPPLALLRRNALVVRLYDRLGSLPVESVPTPAPEPAAAPASKPAGVSLLPAALPVSSAASRVAASLAPPPTGAVPPVAAPAQPPAARREEPAEDYQLSRRTRFWRQDDAERYLQFWRGDADAMRTLRFALHRSTQGSALFAHDNEHVIRLVAAQLARGALLLTENLPPPPPPMPPVQPKGAAAAAAAAVPAAAPLVAMDPVSLPKPPLLPILEEVQIEGADVLPEVLQSLEQIDLAIGEINTASVSLEPTPSKIPDISKATADASASVNATIDAL